VLTSRGAGTAGAAVALYAVGWALGYPQLCALAVTAAAALLAGAAFLLPRSRLRVRREIAPTRIVRGDAAIGVVQVTNAGRRAARPVTATDRCGTRAVPVALPRLAAGATRTTSYELPTLRRGQIPVGPLTLTRGDPFGFFQRTSDYGGQLLLIVAPRPVPLALLASGHAASLDGLTTDAAPSGTTTFHALREYVLGDELRHVHWRTSARVGTLMVRQLVDSSEPRTTVVLDTCARSYHDDDFETAVDIAASVATAAARQGFPVSLVTPSGTLFAGRGGRPDVEAILDLLALVEAGSGGLADALSRLPGARASGSLTVVTGAAQVAHLDRVAAAASRYERGVTVRVGSALPALPDPFPMTVVDAADTTAFAAAWNRAGRP
jgi:uncharacterized protein (DUF58 family)